jgi:hypothetical protein
MGASLSTSATFSSQCKTLKKVVRGFGILQEALSNINPVKGIKDSFGAKTLMSRAAIDVRPFSDQPGKAMDKWYDLGTNEWSHEEGTVSPTIPPALTSSTCTSELWRLCI